MSRRRSPQDTRGSRLASTWLASTWLVLTGLVLTAGQQPAYGEAEQNALRSSIVREIPIAVEKPTPSTSALDPSVIREYRASVAPWLGVGFSHVPSAEPVGVTDPLGPATPTQAAMMQQRAGDLAPGDQLAARQAVISREFSELERRMFRLSESLRDIQPDEAARLTRGLQHSRSAQIYRRMHVLQSELRGLQGPDATAGQESLLLELRHLHTMLLAGQHDPALLLEQLRTMKQLEQQLRTAQENESASLAITQDLAAQAADSDRRSVAKPDASDSADDGPRENLSLEDALHRQHGQELNHRRTAEQMAHAADSLGASGQACGEHCRAAGQDMQNASEHLQDFDPESAQREQLEALRHLAEAEQALGEQQEELLDEVRPVVKQKVLAGLRLLLEQQTALRRELVATHRWESVATQQDDLSQMALELVQLVADTDFGVALPAALRVVGAAMSELAAALRELPAEQDAPAERLQPFVTQQQRIELDLASLIDALERMPASGPAKGGKPQPGSPAQNKEMNRLLAELQMLRLLQERLHGETQAAEHAFPHENGLSDDEGTVAPSFATVRPVSELHALQADLQRIARQLSILRGHELPLLNEFAQPVDAVTPLNGRPSP